MKTEKQKLGTTGEDLAAAYLQQCGYRLVCRNYRAGKNEIDLICLDNEDLVFVEVKSAHGSVYGGPASRVSLLKQRSVIRAAYYFLNRNKKYRGKNVRFDVLCMNMNAYPAGINHYKGAFWEQRF